MVKREFQSKKRYFASFLIGTVVFLLVIGLSYSVAIYQYTRVSDIQGATAYSLFEKKSAYTFFGEDICSGKNLEEISLSLGYQGKALEDLEKKFGRGNVQVLERKKFYSVLLLEHLDYLNSYNEECEDYRNNIIFFYSNLGDASPSENAGKVLDGVNFRDNKVSIYSFDINLDSSIVQKLKEKYGIISAPTIIINGEQELKWPFSIGDVESELR